MGKKAAIGTGLALAAITAIVVIATCKPLKTLVIAANDSYQVGANYICTGVNDQEVIQAVIYELESLGGGRLLLRAGNYYLSPSLGAEYYLTTSGNITFEGEDMDNTTLWLENNNIRGGIQTEGWRWNPPYAIVSPIKFKNLTINCGSPQGFVHSGDGLRHFHPIEASVESLILDNVRIVADNSTEVTTRVFLWHCKSIDYLNSIFDGVNSWMFSSPVGDHNPDHLTGEHCLVSRCLFTNTSAYHMPLGGGMKNFTVVDSEFRGCLHGTAIDVFISPGARILRNTIVDCVGSAIYSEGGYDVQIKDNYIRNIEPGETGWGFGVFTADNLHIRSGGKVLIENNDIDGCGIGICSHGVPDVTIRNNTVRNTWGVGINLSWLSDNNEYYDGVPSYSDGCKVTDNKVTAFGTHKQWSKGIQLCNVMDCLIEHNDIDGEDNPNASCGIFETRNEGTDLRVGCPDYNIIKGNTITGAAIPIKTVGEHTVVE